MTESPLDMAYQVIARTPKGKPSRYLDTDTGESISARQYRNRTEAAKSGYRTLSQKQTATKKHVTVSRTGLVQHHYFLGLPASLAQAVSDIIRQYEYRDSFAIGATYEVYEEGSRPYEQTVQSTLSPCLPRYIRGAIDELKLVIMLYGNYKVKHYFVTIYPPKGDL